MSSHSTDGLKITSRVTLLEPGMYIFRYASQTTTNKSVYIALQQAPLGKGLIDFFPAEGISKNMLTKLGDCIIGRVKNGVTTVLITEYHLANVEVDPVDLRIDRIDTSAAIMRNFTPQTPNVDTTTVSAAPASRIAHLNLLGHIKSRGDITASQEWLGTPDGQDRLEGFVIDWADRPEGVDLVYTCTIAGSGPSPKMLTGQYSGTRGKGLALVAVGFGLAGPQRGHYQINGEVAFAGSAPQAITADQMLFGPTGKEPLVAIKLSISFHPEINAPRYQSPWESPATTQKLSSKGQLA